MLPSSVLLSTHLCGNGSFFAVRPVRDVHVGLLHHCIENRLVCIFKFLFTVIVVNVIEVGISENSVDTYVTGNCMKACTTGGGGGGRERYHRRFAFVHVHAMLVAKYKSLYFRPFIDQN